MLICAQENAQLYYFIFPDEKPADDTEKQQQRETE